jgi:hypothetical protein
VIGAAAKGEVLSCFLELIGFRAILRCFAFQRAYFLPRKKTPDPRSKATSLYPGWLLSSRCASRGIILIFGEKMSLSKNHQIASLLQKPFQVKKK